MSLLLFANNAQTTLAGPIASGATSLNLAAGTGSEFPNPGAGQYFVMTLNDQATKLIREIIWVTARSGDTCTIVRGQEGTSAQAWLANDIAANWWTAGQAAAMIQVAQLQIQATNYAMDTGTTNALAVTLVPPPSSLSSITGSPIRTVVANTNTGSTTLSVNGLGSTVITNPDGTNLAQGQLIAGHVYEFAYNGSTFDLLSSPYQLLKSANNWSGRQTFAGGVTFPNNVYAYGNDTSGVPHQILGYGNDNVVHTWGGSGGWALTTASGGINSLFADASGNVIVGQGLATTGLDTYGFSVRYNATGGKQSGWRNDGTNTYFLLTGGGSSFNSLRPIVVNNTTGQVSLDPNNQQPVLFGGAAQVGTTLSVGGTATANYIQSSTGVTSDGGDSFGFNIRFAAAGYNAGWRIDGSYAYLLLTNLNGTTYNGLRPFYVQLSNGAVTLDGTGAGVSSGGNITAGGRLRATNGALNSGDNSAAAILADFASTKSGAGYQYLPSGLIFQWTTISAPGNSTPTAYNYPIAFPNLSLFVCGCYQANLPPSSGAFGVQLSNNSQFVATNTANGGSNGCNVWAVGY